MHTRNQNTTLFIYVYNVINDLKVYSYKNNVQTIIYCNIFSKYRFNM